MQRRQGWNAQAICCLEPDSRRQRHSLRLRQGDVLRSRAHWALPLSVPKPDTLADVLRRHLRANVDNDAGTVAVHLQGSFRYRAADVGEFVLERPRDSALDDLLAPLHRYAPRRLLCVNYREGGFDNGVGPHVHVHPVKAAEGAA